jgi:hypothetical protein
MSSRENNTPLPSFDSLEGLLLPLDPGMMTEGDEVGGEMLLVLLLNLTSGEESILLTSLSSSVLFFCNW